jgi:uncharacterized protein (DUF362 family)
MTDSALSRRGLLAGAGLLTSTLLGPRAFAADNALVASPPAGFSPMRKAGRVVKVTKGNDFGSLMQNNLLWPKAEVAKAMVERALTELTGAANLVEALGKLIHKDDIVAIKPNGIAGQSGATMAANLEVVLPLVEGLIALGVPADKITVYEQYPSYLNGTRVKKGKVPAGVKLAVHGNQDATMAEIAVFDQVKTKYVRPFTEATAVINVTNFKDHSICGFTGCMKNITHGSIINPQKHHANHANPQIAVLYAHDIVKSRVRLHIVDAFKIIYDKGPLDKDPKRRIPHGAIYAGTDPVALDTVGWQVIDKARKENGMKTLAQAGREPKYIATAASLGLGTHAEAKISLREVTL